MFLLARLLEAWDDADVGRERAGGAEVGGIAQFGDQACGGGGADAVDGGQQAADLMFAQFAVDVAVEFAQAAAQEVEVLAEVTHLDAISGAVVLADGALGSVDQGPRQILARRGAVRRSASRPSG